MAGTEATCRLAFPYCLLASPSVAGACATRRVDENATGGGGGSLPTALADRLGSQSGSVFRWRHPYAALEHAVETGNRPKPCGIDNLGNPQRRIHQECLCLFHADARDIFGQGHTGRLLEQLAEIKPADMDVLHHLFEADGFFGVG